MKSRPSIKGFTLFELVVVITISGFVMSLMAYFYVGFIKNKLYEAKRLAVFERQILTQEYLSKYIKNALPMTLKVSVNQQCVEFLSVLGAGVFSPTSNGDEKSPLKKVFLDDNAKKNYKVSHYISLNKNITEVNELHSISAISEYSIGIGVIDADVSPAFVTVSDVNRFCIHDKQLRFYKDGNFSTYTLVAEDVFSKKPFAMKKIEDERYQLGIDLNFGDGSLSLNSEYYIIINHEF